jgi:CMP-N-acetylneuraminic acid synthetase
MLIAMIPARFGSQRLKQKNLRELAGTSLLARAVRKCLQAKVFDEVWVNSEHEAFGEIALREGAKFHRRPAELANDTATSEQFIAEFLRCHPCRALLQVHSIAPLLTASEVAAFTTVFAASACDVQLSVVEEQIECAYQNQPINFRSDRKTNSQELAPIQRIAWSITGFRPTTYLAAFDRGECATYAGAIAYQPISRLAGHIIKTEEDLKIAEALLPLVEDTIQPRTV